MTALVQEHFLKSANLTKDCWLAHIGYLLLNKNVDSVNALYDISGKKEEGGRREEGGGRKEEGGRRRYLNVSFFVFFVKILFIFIIREMLIFRFLFLWLGEGDKSLCASDCFKYSGGEKESGNEEGRVTMNSILL